MTPARLVAPTTGVFVAALVGAAVAGAWSRPPHDRVAAGLGVAAGLAAIAAATALVFQRVASRPSAAGALDQIRVNHVLCGVPRGVAAMLIALSIGTAAVIVLHVKNPAQTLAAALGPVGTLIGTLAGAVSGHRPRFLGLLGWNSYGTEGAQRVANVRPPGSARTV